MRKSIRYQYCDEEREYARHELAEGVPVEEVLLSLYHREAERGIDRDSASFTLGVLEEACIALNIPVDKHQWLEVLHNNHVLDTKGKLLLDVHRELEEISRRFGTRGYECCVARTDEAIYSGKVIETTGHFVIQETSSNKVYLHSRGGLDQHGVVSGQRYTIHYLCGNASVRQLNNPNNSERSRELSRDR